MKILLTRTDRVGDLILSTPAIATIRRAFADAHITLACSRYNAVVVERNPDLDTVDPIPTGITPEVAGSRYAGVDLAIALGPRAFDIALAGATGAPRRIGYTYRSRHLTRIWAARRLTDVLLSDADPSGTERDPSRVVPHEVDQVLALAVAAGATDVVRDLVVPIGEADRARVAGLPRDAITVQLGRRWSESGSTTEMLLALLRDLRRFGKPLVATYADDGAELARAVEAAGVVDALAGGLPFGAWAAAFERAACIITIDTGATHVASATRRPTVVLFEHRWFRLASQEWSPYRVPNAVLRKPARATPAATAACRAEIVAAVARLL